MDFTNIFVILFTTGTVFDFVLNQFLEFTDYSSRKKNGTKVPAEIKGLIDEATLKKTCSYENAKYFMWIPRAALMLILDFVLVFTFSCSIFSGLQRTIFILRQLHLCFFLPFRLIYWNSRLNSLMNSA